MLPSSLPTLTRMRELQGKHDEACHRDVASLSDREKLRHYVFHLAKYAGALTPTGLLERPLEQTLVDTMIISLAMANVLERYDLESFVQEQRTSQQVQDDQVSIGWLKDELVYHVGKMAKLSEGHDHMENLSYRSEYAKATAKVILAVTQYADHHKINLMRLIQDRWNFIRENKVA
jgi:hypothetical protein